MATDTLIREMLSGGHFLVSNTDYKDIFIPEDSSEEQEMIRQTIRDFIQQEIRPHTDRIEKLEEGLIPSIMEKFAELGFFGTHMPENYGGSAMDFITNTIIGEEVGPSGSFSVSYNAHSGIGMLPILYFGTEAQKKKYLPGLIDGSLKSSYCLTEPSSGSDALAAKTTAILNPEKTHYILNGQKMWITNAGFADIFTVFAQADGDKFTGFIIEKNSEGLTLGAEEKKLGIKGSSTRMVFLENVKVPVENVLGDIGKGHLIAFNVLNIGRFKLGASTMGASKMLVNVSTEYATEREQFDTKIAQFGAIKHKLAEQTIRSFISESIVYRAAHSIQQMEEKTKSDGMSFEESKLEAAEEYALECSIIKVVCSEVLDFCVDEAVQIFGGMGYSEEGYVARAYRDSRINRIFEGTNEINRLLIISTLLKRAMKGKLDLMTPAMAVQKELMEGVTGDIQFSGPYPEEQKALSSYKKVLIMLLGTAAQKAMSGGLDLKTEQEIVLDLSELIIEIYNTESALLRCMKRSEMSERFDLDLDKSLIRTIFHDANNKIYTTCLTLTGNFIDDSLKAGYISGIRKFTKYPLQNTKENRRKIANAVIDKKGYCF
ncbi:MAG: acyl-CoA dehydrogenase family protein [Saprospiraceae bacterium]|nr:acyl-CoA dehydrogenase family protein [Saprospiraceae bacterium]MBP6693630.1 acyl-CoA dehydrogenase family protein [Saprospiraceae bacterium]